MSRERDVRRSYNEKKVKGVQAVVGEIPMHRFGGTLKQHNTQSEAHTEAQKPSKHTERDSEAKAERHYMCAHVVDDAGE